MDGNRDLPQRRGTPFDDYILIATSATMANASQAAEDAARDLEHLGSGLEHHPVALSDGRQKRLAVRGFHLARGGAVVIFREVLEAPVQGKTTCRYVAVNRADGKVLHGVFEGTYGDQGAFVETAILGED